MFPLASLFCATLQSCLCCAPQTAHPRQELQKLPLRVHCLPSPVSGILKAVLKVMQQQMLQHAGTRDHHDGVHLSPPTLLFCLAAMTHTGVRTLHCLFTCTHLAGTCCELEAHA